MTLALLSGLIGLAGIVAPASAQNATPNSPGQPAPAGTSGIIVHIDPQTGAILKEPAPGTVPLQLTPKETAAMSTSHEGLAEVPSAVPGGGVKVDLQGRFRSPLIANVGPDGKVRLQHLGEPHQ